jgi:hypothetical protein
MRERRVLRWVWMGVEVILRPPKLVRVQEVLTFHGELNLNKIKL